jgi:hypothetical protein
VLGRLGASALALGASSLLAAAVLALAAPAQGSRAADLSLLVTFSTDGTITVTLPDGTPVGAASGPPTVIPAGYYTLVLTGPGGCAALPYFELEGPGENIVGNMSEGQVTNLISNAYFQPNSTYTWRNGDANPPVAYTFATSGDVEGAPAAASSAPSSSPAGGVTSNTDAVGSGSGGRGSGVAFRGTLVATVNSAGRATLAYRGRSVATLSAGRYTIALTDRSRSEGFVLARRGHAPIRLAGGGAVGTRSASLDLAPGQWSFASSLRGAKTYFVVAP